MSSIIENIFFLPSLNFVTAQLKMFLVDRCVIRIRLCLCYCRMPPSPAAVFYFGHHSASAQNTYVTACVYPVFLVLALNADAVRV